MSEVYTWRQATSSKILHLHKRDVRTLQRFQSPASIMIVVPTMGEERQCDPVLSFFFYVSNTAVTTVERPESR